MRNSEIDESLNQPDIIVRHCNRSYIIRAAATQRIFSKVVVVTSSSDIKVVQRL